jgi:2-methylcitrate dehydratase PrpD
VKDVFFSKYGYFSLYCKSYQPEVLIKNLGKAFYADMTCKPYPCCRSTHAAIDCVLDLVCSNDIKPEDVEEVVVDVPLKARDFAVGQHFNIREVPQIDASFSLQYTVATALLRKDVRLEHFTEEFIRDPRLMDIIERIKLTATIPPEKPLAAAVKIRTKQGIEYEKRVDIPKGHGISTPLTYTEKKDKFFANVEFSGTISREKARKVVGLIENMEGVDNVADIAKLLVPL